MTEQLIQASIPFILVTIVLIAFLSVCIHYWVTRALDKIEKDKRKLDIERKIQQNEIEQLRAIVYHDEKPKRKPKPEYEMTDSNFWEAKHMQLKAWMEELED